MASVGVLAELSAVVYQDDPTSPLPGWVLVERYVYGPFFAALYHHDRDGEHVLAVRGTDPPSLDDWLDDRRIVKARAPDQFAGLQRAALQALTAAAGRPFYTTGHSLGGALATLAAATYRLPCVTFNALGVAHVLAVNGLWDRTDFTRLLHVRSSRDVAFWASPTCGRHIVLTYPTPPIVGWDALPWLAVVTMQPSLLLLSSMRDAANRGWGVIYQHQMAPLCAAVRREPEFRSDLRWTAPLPGC